MQKCVRVRVPLSVQDMKTNNEIAKELAAYLSKKWEVEAISNIVHSSQFRIEVENGPIDQRDRSVEAHLKPHCFGVQVYMYDMICCSGFECDEAHLKSTYREIAKDIKQTLES